MYVTWFRHILLCGFMCQIQTHSPTQLAARVCYPPCLSDTVVLKYNMKSEQNKIRCPRILLFFCFVTNLTQQMTYLASTLCAQYNSFLKMQE